MTEQEMKELARDIAKTYMLSTKDSFILTDIELYIKAYIRTYKAALKIIKEDSSLNKITEMQQYVATHNQEQPSLPDTDKSLAEENKKVRM